MQNVKSGLNTQFPAGSPSSGLLPPPPPISRVKYRLRICQLQRTCCCSYIFTGLIVCLDNTSWLHTQHTPHRLPRNAAKIWIILTGYWIFSGGEI